MSSLKRLDEQKKLEITGRLLALLEKEIPADEYADGEKDEVLMLAYHASTSTHDLRTLIRAIG